MTDQTTEPTPTTDSGHGNPPPKDPKNATTPPTTDSIDDSGHGNPPPKGDSLTTPQPSAGSETA